MHVVHARRAVAAIFFMFGTFLGAWASRIRDIKAVLGVEEAGFGLILLAMASGAFVAFPFTGHWVDRFGAVRVTKLFAFGLLTMFVVLSVGVTVLLMVPIAFLTGFCIGGLDVSMNGWGAEVEKALGRPVMSSYHGLYSLGAAVGAAAGAGALWLDLSVLVHFALWGALMGVLLTAAARVGWTSDRRSPGSGKSPFLAIPTGALLLVGLMALASALAEGAVTDWAAIYQIEELGFSSARAVIGFSIFSIAMVVMRLAGDQLIARFGPVKVVRISGCAAFVGTVLIVWGANIWVVWLGCAIMGLGNAVIFPVAMSRAAADPVLSPGTAIAAVATLGYGAYLLGPPVLGFIGQVLSLRASFALVAVLALIIPFAAGALKVRR
ncbi:MAG: MFS transporter [Roseibium sp.]|nr:MFS transporter [Roseibium sp.]